MCRVLVFSKDRPMQLHAYLESLLLFSDIQEENISVLYCNKDNISYKRVKSSFRRVDWISEIEFGRQVREWIENNQDEYIMFGCDDVVFKDFFHISEIERFLKNNDDIFGLSIRLGRNLDGCPSDYEIRDKFCVWNWQSNKLDNFHYPWELDCTVYRACDVKDIINKCNLNFENPNYFEEFVELAPTTYIHREKLACYNEKGKAIVITINRVQDTHCNPVDDSIQTDPETLSYLYNEKNYRLDVKKISKKRNKTVHVNSSFFILFPKLRTKKRNGLFKRKCKLFLKNMIYLTKIDLEKDGFREFVETKDAEVSCLVEKYSHPIILPPEETVRLLIDNPKSFTRFGDGELSILSGKSIPFQTYEPELQAYLLELIRNTRDDIYVGLPFFYFYPSNNLTPMVRDFVMVEGKTYRDIINKYASMEREYIDTSITQLYQTYIDYNFSHYFVTVQSLFKNKLVTLVVNNEIYDSYNYNLFSEAEDLDIINAPKINAYAEFREIVEVVKTKPKNRLICVVLGPTAKAITVELTNEGYMVWDIGHLLKDYNCFMNGMPRTFETITNFYKPD